MLAVRGGVGGRVPVKVEVHLGDASLVVEAESLSDIEALLGHGRTAAESLSRHARPQKGEAVRLHPGDPSVPNGARPDVVWPGGFLSPGVYL